MSKYHELVQSLTSTLLAEASQRLSKSEFGTQEWAAAYEAWWGLMEVIYELE